MRDYDDIRRRLVTRREELENRVSRIKKKLRHSEEPIIPDFAEQATQRQNEEVLDALDEAGRRELILIQGALERIDQGDYGICVDCGAEIPLPRLNALPFTDRCVACAEKAENE